MLCVASVTKYKVIIKRFFKFFLLSFPLQLKSEMRKHLVVTGYITRCDDPKFLLCWFKYTVELVIVK